MRCKTSVVVTFAFVILCLLIYLLLQNAISTTFSPIFENLSTESKDSEYIIANVIQSRDPEFVKISQPNILTSAEFEDRLNEEINVITAPGSYNDAELDLLQQLLHNEENIDSRISEIQRKEWNEKRQLWDNLGPQLLQPTFTAKPQSKEEEKPTPILEQILKSSVPQKQTLSNESQITEPPLMSPRILRTKIPEKGVQLKTATITPISEIPSTLDIPVSSTPNPKLSHDAPRTTVPPISSSQSSKKQTPSTQIPMMQTTTHGIKPTEPAVLEDIFIEGNSTDESYANEPPILATSPSIIETKPNLTDVSTYECCDADKSNPLRKNILFLKLHKTAGGTVQNILMRFGLRNELDFILPTIFNYIPSHYSLTIDQLPQETKPVDGKYNILTHYMIYHPDLKTFMYPDTVTVTILRSPASVFESMYNHYLLNLQYGDLNEFLKSPPPINSQNDFIPVLHGFNQMSADLGLNRNSFENDTAIQLFIRSIDRDFDFVMIAEHFDECLVLLTHLMGWSLNDVAYLPMNRRNIQYKYHLLEPDREKLNDLNRVDSMLYKHFLNKFYVCREQFGIQRLEEEVKILRDINRALEERCVLSEHVLPIVGTIGYDLKNSFDWECIYATKYENFFTEELRYRQTQRIYLNRTAFSGKI